MSRVNLQQIEADVVLVGINHEEHTVYVRPLWECETPLEDLWEQAAMFGSWCAERDGGGTVQVEIHDFRGKV